MDDIFEECGPEEETTEHILRRCPTLEIRRYLALGQHYCSEEAGEVDIETMIKAAIRKCFGRRKIMSRGG